MALSAAGPTPTLVARPIQRRALDHLHRLVSVAAWPRGGIHNDSSTVLLGADFDSTGPRVALLSIDFANLVRELNMIVATSLRDPSFVWSSLLIEVNTVSGPRALPFATGPALTFAHGKHVGNACVLGCPIPPRSSVVHDAMHSVILPAFSGYRVVVTALLHSAAAGLAPKDRDALRAAGFTLPFESCSAVRGPAGQEQPGARVPGGSRKAAAALSCRGQFHPDSTKRCLAPNFVEVSPMFVGDCNFPTGVLSNLWDPVLTSVSFMLGLFGCPL